MSVEPNGKKIEWVVSRKKEKPKKQLLFKKPKRKQLILIASKEKAKLMDLFWTV